MSGLMGYVRAGVAGGAGAAKDAYQLNQQFDLRQALMEAQADKELALKRAGIEMDNEYAQKERERAQEVYDRHQKDQRGGYQSPEAAAAEEDDLDNRRLQELAREGLLKSDLGVATASRMAGRDKLAREKSELDYKTWKVEQENAVKSELNNIRRESLEARERRLGAGGSSGKKSDDDVSVKQVRSAKDKTAKEIERNSRHTMEDQFGEKMGVNTGDMQSKVLKNIANALLDKYPELSNLSTDEFAQMVQDGNNNGNKFQYGGKEYTIGPSTQSSGSSAPVRKYIPGQGLK